MFYALIALVLMFWIWPLTRDLRVLREGRSAIWQPQLALRRRDQAALPDLSAGTDLPQNGRRIDGLIASHKDMSNAVSHEIKTPLSRMQFEIELAQQAHSMAEVKPRWPHQDRYRCINGLVKGDLGLRDPERADLALNLAGHDFTRLIPAIVESVRHDAKPDIAIAANVQNGADHVVCDIHLFETVLKTCFYNASAMPRGRINVTFISREGLNELLVEDDGPEFRRRSAARIPVIRAA